MENLRLGHYKGWERGLEGGTEGREKRRKKKVVRKGEGNVTSFCYCLAHSRTSGRITCFVFIFIIGSVESYLTCAVSCDLHSKSRKVDVLFDLLLKPRETE